MRTVQVSRLMLHKNVTFVYTYSSDFETNALHECHFCVYLLYMFRDWCSTRMSRLCIPTVHVSRLMLYTNVTFVYTYCTGLETDALHECHFCLYVLYMSRDWCSTRMSLLCIPSVHVSRLMLYTNVTFVYTYCTCFETNALYECHFCVYLLYRFRDWCSTRMSLLFIRTAQVSRLMLYKNVTPCFKKSSATLSVILLQMQIRVGMGMKSGMLAQTTPLWHLITASVRISLHTQVLRYSL